MKKIVSVTVAALAALSMNTASAFFGNDNKWEDPECWNNPYDCNPYDPWDPRYWMEEMESFWDDNGSGPWGGNNYGGGYPMMPYGGQYGAPRMPYGQPMMPQGAPMMPQGAPAMPYGMPYQPRPMAPAAPAAPAK